MNSFTTQRVYRIKHEVNRLADDEYEAPDEIIAALNDIVTHIGHVMPAGSGPQPPRLIYSWPVENQDDKGFSYGIMGSDGGSSDPMAMPSSFQALVLPQGGKLSSVKLWVRSQTGNFDVKVQVMAAGGVVGAVLPTGPVLAESEVIPNASIDRVDGSMQEFLFTGANQIDLVAGESYAFVFTYDAVAFPPSGEYLYFGCNWASTPPNNGGYNQNGWKPDEGCTFTMYLYAQ